MKNHPYKQKCNNCLSVWKYYSNYCPECGSQDIYKFHPNNCNCEQCYKIFHLVKIPQEIGKIKS